MNIKTCRTIGPTSDLVVIAPWKSGLIDAEEAILYSSRFNITFDTLYKLRRLARESVECVGFSDPIERLEQIHSFRMVALPEAMMLSVTYDFGWEPYMRKLWGDARPFLDLLCCHCEGYPLATDDNLVEWSNWIREHQRESSYFYSATALTVSDLQAYDRAARVHLEEGGEPKVDLKLAGLTGRSSEELARQNRERAPQAATQQALRILATMHRLTRYFGADLTASSSGALREDARTLLIATRGLLEGWDPSTLTTRDQALFARELAWFEQAPPRQSGMTPSLGQLNRSNIQRGILTGFDDPEPITHGAALYFAVVEPDEARRTLAALELTSEAPENPRADPIFRNVAFTFGGLSALKLRSEILDAMPVALREGAAARAGQVGDVRSFHPDRWSSLERNWPSPNGGQTDPDLVDVVIQLRTTAGDAPRQLTPQHPLYDEIKSIAGATGQPTGGLKLLSVELLAPATPVTRNGARADHLGLSDGISQPVVSVAGSAAEAWSDTIEPGDLLVRPRPQAPDSPPQPPLADGSFLAIRRMTIMRDKFDATIKAAAARTGLDPELIKSKLLGRTASGAPLVPSHGANDFVYADDPEGAACPRQSHIRRVNPREGGRRIPRIMRRGMSFGPAAGTESDQPRGSLFMAYCADLAEQYEVLLRWVNGGNSTQLPSAQADPICGVPDKVRDRIYRFTHEGQVHRITLPTTGDSYIRLDWSMYLFAPSIEFVRSLPALASTGAPGGDTPIDQEVVDRARAIYSAFKPDPSKGKKGASEDQWRQVLDEPGAKRTGLSRAVWNLVREEPGGVLQANETLHLVGSHERVLEVLRDDGRRFSVSGQAVRIRGCIGEFHLGFDAYTPAYKREGPACNDAIESVDQARAFHLGRSAAAQVLKSIMSDRTGPVSIDIVKRLLEPTAMLMAPSLFGLPDKEHVVPGGADWRPVSTRTPVFPGDFWNQSRYAFNPFEAPETGRLAGDQGKAILAAVKNYIRVTGRGSLQGEVTKQLAGATVNGGPALAFPTDDDLARVLVGAMLGWVPATLGTATGVLEQLFSTGEFQRLQLKWLDLDSRDASDADACFGPSLRGLLAMGAVPENIWREAAVPGQLGSAQVKAKDKIAVSLESAAADVAGRGGLDYDIRFGRSADEVKPTSHGCPGKSIAVGMLLGMLAALAEEATVKYRTRYYVDISRRL